MSVSATQITQAPVRRQPKMCDNERDRGTGKAPLGIALPAEDGVTAR